MPQGYSLHIGLNHVDPAGYNGWSGQLAGCLNDANAMQAICSGQGFTTSCLLDEQANAAAVLAAVDDLAGKAVSGDTVVISYSGHGGQVPDTTGTEDDGQCETWVCFDRMVVDKELFAKWSSFQAGVHIEVFSDSCHSGTVIRELIITTGAGGAPDAEQANQLRIAPIVLRDYNTVFKPAAIALDKVRSMTRVSRSTPPPVLTKLPARMIPPALALTLFQRDYTLYSRVQKRPGPIACSVALISGCQDNQTSADGTNNGLFTEKLLQVWDSGNFAGDYSQFYKAVLALMPADQTPNYLKVGAPDAAMECSRPLTLVSGGATSANPPKISGPATIARGDAAPSFSVDAGSDRNYVVEVATDTALFADSSGRTSDNFFATWTDGPRLTDPTYTLPDPAWQCLKAADRIYYRAGSTTSTTGWDDYLVSTDDADAANAPFIAVSASADAGETGQPADGGTTDSSSPNISITGPDSFDRASTTGPGFTITSSLPYFIVEIATDTAQFADSSGRTSGNFYATWDDSAQPARLTGGDFTLPDAAWQALCGADQLYYRAGATSSETGWDDYIVSTDDSAASSAPSISIATRSKSAPPRSNGGYGDDGGSSTRSRKKDKTLVPA